MATFSEEDIWRVLEAYARKNSLVNNQIESYDDFVNFGMQEIIDQESTIALPNYTVKFGQISLAPPQVIEEDRSLQSAWPIDARRRDLNYDSAILCDITETYLNGDEKEVKTHPRVVIGRMPVMLRSSICNLSKLNEDESIQKGECPNDPGGYFIIKGNERVLVGQMRGVYNQVCVLRQKAGEKYKWIAETRSMSDETGHSVLLQAMIGNDERTIDFSLPYIKQPIPVGVVFKAFGYSEEDIANLIGLDSKKANKYIRFILRDSFFCSTQEDALKHISQYAMHIITENKEENYAWQVVETETLPHLGISGSIAEQACFLGRMVRRLIMTDIGERIEDNRDNYTNKRVETAGTLLYDIFRNLYKKYIQFIKAQLEKRKQRPDVMSIVSRIKSITKGLHQCISTGNWGVQKNASYVRTGVSQILDRMTYGATLSHLRRLIIPTGKEGKNTAMRQIHGSGFGFVCPCETPEGAKIGVVLNYALLTRITKKIPKVQVKAVIEKCRTITSVDEMNFADIKNFAAVILNGNVIGFAEDPDETVREIRNKRSQGLFNKEVSVSYDVVDNDIRIFCDEGRFTRPLLTLTDNRLNITSEERYKWGSLIRKGIVQYVDAAEIENCVIAMTHQDLLTQQNDFCEIHPSTMLGIMAAMIPFPDHSQSPRNCYQSSMGKQALGMPVLSYNLRTDTLLHVLHYPQRPLVCTKAAEIFKINEMPSGINAIVAIACYSGYNQEDSVMLNLSSIQRGMFCLTSYHTIDCSEKKRDTYSFEEICMPPKNSEPDVKVGQPGYFRRKNANYSLLDENGVIRPRERFENGRWVGPATVVKKGDVLIGKVVVTTDKSSAETKIDASVIIQPGEEGTIDRVHVVITPNGYKLVKIVIRVTREPTLGDKLASRAAQKGTIGMVYRQEDMPFTQQGITPDIIINPLCLGKDSHISLSDGTCERIDKIVKNEKEYSVRTVDPLNFQEKITAISDSFAIRPTKPMVSVKTWSGREIICTDDHQFLTAQNEWKKASELKPNQDMLTIVHCTKRLCEEGELPNLALDSIPYRKQLESFVLTERKLQILARLLGAIETDGHLCVRSGTEAKTMRYRVLFYIGEEEDANDMARDIISLGFPPPSSRCVVTQKDGKPYMKTWRVEAKPALGYILHSLGAHTGRKSVSEKIFPKWLINASKETKRQFLCGIQGGDGSYVAVNVKTVQQQIRIRSTKMTARNSVFDSHLEYMGAIQNLFIELGINCTIRIEQPKDKNSKEIGIAISVKMENLEKYTDLISYAYCNHKQRRSRLPIEFLRLRNRGIHMPFTKMQEFMRKDTVAMYVESVTSVPTENLVYDFATCADTHSFVANSIVVHNCMPSRMTINQLIECALGKECAINGTYGDATPFTTGSVNVADKLTERVGKNLHDYGFQAQGWETMYNGMTGEMINARIFIGPTYYQRLKHMVDDKMHARAQGHVTMLTRQPLEGRSRDGGLRFGEMERDCMIGHGDAEMLRERLFLVSDPFKVSVCNKCGVVTSGVRECQVCKGDQVSSCNIPYASKLLHQELTAMGLKMTIRPDEKSN